MEGIEKEDLSKQVERLEQEGRMVLPGIQALFGFQLIAVFSNGFFEHLNPTGQGLHFLALVCTALSALLIMTPAAYHRHIEQGYSSHKFVHLASHLICHSMNALALGLSLDMGIIAQVIFKNSMAGIVTGICSLLLYIYAWIIYPRLHSPGRE